MALLTPLNVNCHASDGRKVRALTDRFLHLSETNQAFKDALGSFGVYFQLEIEGKCSILVFVLKNNVFI